MFEKFVVTGIETAQTSKIVQVSVNGQPRQIAQGSTVGELLESLQLTDRYVAVEVNLQLVPRQEHAAHRLAEGDRLEIVTLVGGG